MVYSLRAELGLHTADVRSVITLPENWLASGSRDHSVVIWKCISEATEDSEATYSIEHTFRSHQHFVNCLLYLGNHLIVSGSADKTAIVWDYKAGTQVDVAALHSAAICSLKTFSNRNNALACFVSCSWDSTARIWSVESSTSSSGLKVSCIGVCEAHEGPVWDCVELPELSIMLTCGADKKIKAWSTGGKLSWQKNSSVGEVQAHDDVVRVLARLNATQVASAANDGLIRLWQVYIENDSTTVSFEALRVISDVHSGHFIYCMSSGSSGQNLVTGGEDNSLSILQQTADMEDFEMAQKIPHMGTVWSVAIDDLYGDIISGCSDGVVRIFSQRAERIAPISVRNAFEAKLREREVAAQTVEGGGVDVKSLPDESALAQAGTKEGQNKIIRNSTTNQAEVYMWSAAELQWQKVGDVVDKKESAGPVQAMVGGKLYDYAFDVGLGDDAPSLKLGYNRGENPYLAAQRFIDDNEMSQEFLDQIANFIEQQVPASALQPAVEAQIPSDPLTGGARYVPGSAASRVGATASGTMDGSPLTAGRYRPSAPNSTQMNTGGVPDGSPLTSGRYRPQEDAAPSTDQAGSGAPMDILKLSKHIPYPHGMVVYSHSNMLEKIEAKIISYKDGNALSEAEKASVHSIVQALSVPDSSSVVFEDDQLAVLCSLLQWPASDVFPVIDLLRLLIARPSGSAYYFGKQHEIDVLGKMLLHMRTPNAPAAVLIIGARLICNMFRNRISGLIVRERMPEILDVFRSVILKSGNERAQEAASAAILNFSQLVSSSAGTPQERELLVSTIIHELNHGSDRNELHVYRYVIALGTLMSLSSDTKDFALHLDAPTGVARAAPLSQRTREAAEEIAQILIL